MKVVYVSPNRAHHYEFADQMRKGGCLHSFVSGFSRLSPRSGSSSLDSYIRRHDFLQTCYLGLNRLGSHRLALLVSYLSKLWLDRVSYRYLKGADVFMFYSGCGLSTVRRIKMLNPKMLTVCEVVSTHVENYEFLVAEENARAGYVDTERHHLGPEINRRILEYHESDVIICASNYVKRTLMDRSVPGEKIEVVPYGVNVTPNQVPRVIPNVFRVLFVGQLNTRKGVRYLIEAFRGLHAVNAELVLVGPVTRRPGFDLADLPSNVKITGPLKGDALSAAYSRASVFVLPSVEDGFGLVIAEAMSHGVPVICSRNTGWEHLFTDGVEGFSVPARDSSSIADRLLRLMNNSKLLATMSNAASDKARSFGGWDVCGDKLVHALRSRFDLHLQHLKK